MIQAVWFKRDLRRADHAALAAACAAGPVLPIVIIEPQLWAQPDMAGRHYAFLCECIGDLRTQLAAIGLTLIVRVGEAVDVLAAIHAETPISTLHSHQETGNGWSYARDRAVDRFCADNGIPWHQPRQTGVVRPFNDRTVWAWQWEDFMTAPVTALPPHLAHPAAGSPSDPLPSPEALGLAPDPCPGRQRGGRADAEALLASFLSRRGRHYHRQMSSPLSAEAACSRLSAHLAFGTLSMREAVQAAYHKRVMLAGQPPSARAMDLRAIDAFIARLHWHCHFIQKLEDEPEIEHQPFHPAFEDAWTNDSEDSAIRLNAWSEGRTGWPFVDACMRSLIGTGWINFRMRAMLVAVASYHLWLDWRTTGPVLAQRFTDYEPGIHWSQMQMQSGATAINTLRIYNPVKQSTDQDEDGTFIRRWVPELASVPTAYIHEPWTMPPSVQAACGVIIGEHYAAPIRDHLQAARDARRKLSAVRASPGFREEQLAVLERHGSRKGHGRGKRAFPKQDRMLKGRGDERQLKLDL